MTSPATQEPCPKCGGYFSPLDGVPACVCHDTVTATAPPSQRAELLTPLPAGLLDNLRCKCGNENCANIDAVKQHIAALTQRVEAAERMAEGIETTDRLRIANAYGYVTDKVSDAILSLRGLSNAYRALSQEPRNG